MIIKSLSRQAPPEICRFDTTNNVPASEFILTECNNIMCDYFDIYNYPSVDINHRLESLFGVPAYYNFGVDAIIKDLFLIFNGCSVYVDEPTYAMVGVYADLFSMEKVPYCNADVVYIASPNGATGEDVADLCSLARAAPNKFFIFDLSYSIYNFDDLASFREYVQGITNHPNTIVLCGMSKMLGLAGERLGFGFTTNTTIMSQLCTYKQPYQVTHHSAVIFDRVFTERHINAHTNIIKHSKNQLQTLYGGVGSGPFLFLTAQEANMCPIRTRQLDGKYRLSVIDTNILRKQYAF